MSKEIPGANLKFPNTSSKNEKTSKGFSTALLFNLSPFRETFLDNQEISDSQNEKKLNTSASAIQENSSSMINDFLSSDLIQKINSLSPISSNEQIKTRISDVNLVNYEDNNSDVCDSDDLLSQTSSEELELKETIPNNKGPSNAPPKDKNSIPQDKLNKSYSNIPHFLDKEKLEPKTVTSFRSEINHSFHYKRNTSNIFSYYDSTSKYLSQADGELKRTDSINNSHNYIPKMLLSNKSLNLSNSESGALQGENNQEEKNFFGQNNNNQFGFNAFSLPYQFDIWNNQQKNEENENLANDIPIPNPNVYQGNFMYNNGYMNPLNLMFSRPSVPNNENEDNFNNQMNNDFMPQNSNALSNQIEQNPFMSELNTNSTASHKNSSKKKKENDPNGINEMTEQKKTKKKKKKNKNGGEQEGDNSEEYLLEMFGRVGWICSQCNNFNYESKLYFI